MILMPNISPKRPKKQSSIDPDARGSIREHNLDPLFDITVLAFMGLSSRGG